LTRNIVRGGVGFGGRVGLGSAGSCADGLLVEVAIEGAAFDAEDVGDLLGGVVALVVEALGGGGLVCGELGPAPALAASGAGRFEPVLGVGDDQLTLEFGEH
jgi:hypothetical protein